MLHPLKRLCRVSRWDSTPSTTRSIREALDTKTGPLGYGSYGTQGAPGAAAYPYHNQAQPQSFEVQEVHRPHERLPCLIGYQLIL